MSGPHSQGSFMGSQPECWEEPAGIMDSIVGIIPRSTPQRATSFTGLLAINEDNDYQGSGPPTPYDNTSESPPDDLPNIGALPTFSFLKVDIEGDRRRNINLSKLYAINPLVSLPPPSGPSSQDLLNVGVINNDSTETDYESTTSTTTSQNGYNDNNNETNYTTVESNNNNDDDDQEAENDDESELQSPPARQTRSATAAAAATSPGTEKRKRGPYNTRAKQLAAAQAAGLQVDDESFGIQPRSKRKRTGAATPTETEVPTSDPDLVTPAPPPSRKARGGATAKRGRGARNVASPPPSSPPTSSSPPPTTALIVTTPASSSTYKSPTNVTSPIVHTAVVPARPPSPTAPNPAVVASQIKNLEARLDGHERQVDDLRTLQSTTLERDANFKGLMNLHETTSAGVRATHCDVDQLIRSVVLEPIDIARVRTLRDNLAALLVRMRVLWREANVYAGTASSSDPCHGALIIREQSPPRVLFKAKDAKDMGKVCVELVTPTKVRCEILTPVSVSLCSTSDNKKDITNIKTLASGDPLLGHKQDINNNMMAIFENLKLTTSTRMICSNLRFSLSMKITGPDNKGKLVEIESEPSLPFIGITNESQWPEAAGKLLYSDAFDGNKIETSWAYYANTLQLHFMTITQQTLESPARKFYPWELRYIHSRFGFRAMLSKDATEKFWNFFGPVLLNIHFKRKIYEMWRDGLIYGLISKEECVSALSKQGPGTFLIRFSESIPGAFAIAYVADTQEKDKIRHYLVKSDELGSNKTLPDYLKEKSLFITILKLDPSTRALEAIPKDEALELMYSKKQTQVTPQGYIGFL